MARVWFALLSFFFRNFQLRSLYIRIIYSESQKTWDMPIEELNKIQEASH